MAKLKLNPDPTFQGKVEVHVPGSAPASVVFTFKHRTRPEMVTFFAKVKEMKDDVELIMAMATGWDLEDEFSKANIKTMCAAYIDFPGASYEAYLKEITGARSGN